MGQGTEIVAGAKSILSDGIIPKQSAAPPKLRPRLFAVVVEDRHTDVAIQVYRTEADAVREAKAIYAIYAEGCIDGDIWEDRTAEHWETECPGVVSIEGRPFHAYYSTEGDCVYVREVKLIGADPRQHVVNSCTNCPMLDGELERCQHPGAEGPAWINTRFPPPPECPLRRIAILIELQEEP